MQGAVSLFLRARNSVCDAAAHSTRLLPTTVLLLVDDWLSCAGQVCWQQFAPARSRPECWGPAGLFGRAVCICAITQENWSAIGRRLGLPKGECQAFHPISKICHHNSLGTHELCHTTYTIWYAWRDTFPCAVTLPFVMAHCRSFLTCKTCLCMLLVKQATCGACRAWWTPGRAIAGFWISTACSIPACSPTCAMPASQRRLWIAPHKQFAIPQPRKRLCWCSLSYWVHRIATFET